MPETTTLPEPESQLKAERIQGITERLKAERIQERLKAERIQSRLEELPGWRTAQGRRALERTYVFPTSRAAAAFITLAAEIGEATGYVPALDLRGEEVTLRVATDGEAGLTDLDFDLAQLFEQRV